MTRDSTRAATFFHGPIHENVLSRVIRSVRHLPHFLLVLCLPACAPAIQNPHAGVYTPPNRAQTEPQPTDSSPPVVEPNRSPSKDNAAAVRFMESLVQLEKLRRDHPERHEAILNEAILLHEYGHLLGKDDQERTWRLALELYQEFIRKAKDDPEAQDSIRVAKERYQMIDDATSCHFKDSPADRKQQEAEEKQRAAEEEARSPELLEMKPQ